MNQAIINPGNITEQLFYPLDHLKIEENNHFEEDDYFVDQTSLGVNTEKNIFARKKIIRTDFGTFIIKESKCIKWGCITFFYYSNIFCNNWFIINKRI